MVFFCWCLQMAWFGIRKFCWLLVTCIHPLILHSTRKFRLLIVCVLLIFVEYRKSGRWEAVLDLGSVGRSRPTVWFMLGLKYGGVLEELESCLEISCHGYFHIRLVIVKINCQSTVVTAGLIYWYFIFRAKSLEEVFSMTCIVKLDAKVIYRQGEDHIGCIVSPQSWDVTYRVVSEWLEVIY